MLAHSIQGWAVQIVPRLYVFGGFVLGFDCQWSQMPSRGEQAAFLRVYLQQQSATATTSAAATSAAATSAAEPDDLDFQVEMLLEEIEPFFAVSHLFWGKPQTLDPNPLVPSCCFLIPAYICSPEL